MKGEGDNAVVVYKPGSASFRKSVLKPELPSDTIDYSSDRFITDSGRWMFSGSTERHPTEGGSQNGHVRAWKRNDKDEFDLFTQFWICGRMSEPGDFQFREENQMLFHMCGNGETSFSVWNLSVNPPQLVETIDTGVRVTSILLLNDQLLVGTNQGTVHFYTLQGQEKPTFNKVVKMVDQYIAKMTYDEAGRRLYTTELRGEKPIKIWDIDDLTKPLAAISAIPRELERTILSGNRKYLAASSEEDSRVMIWDTEDLSLITFSEHSSWVRDMALMGDSSLVVSGSVQGALKIWDLKNPDIPAVTFFPGLAKRIKNIAVVPNRNEFVVETNDSHMFHYRLESITAILKRTCEAVQAYLHYMREQYPEQVTVCKALQAAR
ncbi:MAG TPA: WD40 repeat domain-containing protein [Oligoflexus sp.]|uniref:WD40 repeat domain-containing protein n=1 Tax=Oligoflexus sp. TaxID=1971216 RepID=UPI002D4A1B90|nr:WD40 repeat domain-containing protein [Oligoflexus sp.]HYX37096.1 WD40 repeat domain-containing protein [Oligoflexus sp.]